MLATIVKVISLAFAVLITGGLMGIPLAAVLYAQKKAKLGPPFNAKVFVKEMASPSNLWKALANF